jgi:hypothetical protein
MSAKISRQWRNRDEKMTQSCLHLFQTALKEPLINLIVIASKVWQSMNQLDCRVASLAMTVNQSFLKCVMPFNFFENCLT